MFSLASGDRLGPLSTRTRPRQASMTIGRLRNLVWVRWWSSISGVTDVLRSRSLPLAMERRLSAIMSADVVGYSRLMGANEVATLDALNDRRTTILEPAIARHSGRVVKLTGDGLLAEFASVVGAVECATEIQTEMSGRNLDLPEDRRIDLRIGINLGDVIAQDGDIYGDGVNLAARIEGAARPGRVAVSQSVRDQVGNRLDVEFEDRGNHELKNIDRPIRIFEVVDGSTAQPPGKAAAAAAIQDKP